MLQRRARSVRPLSSPSSGSIWLAVHLWSYVLCAVAVSSLVAGESFAQDDDAAVVDETILDRMGYGPDAWSRERVGERFHRLWYIVEQLEPDTIDDSEFTALIADFSTLGLSTTELRQNYCAGCALGDADQPLDEAAAAKILRAIVSRRQLEAVMTDFWFNWFNVDARNGLSHWGVIPYERDAIRPHVFGRFEDMLIAVAQSSAMLDYLDNRFNRINALNENYARELLELHTIGVDAFEQSDVIEVARAMSGWTLSGEEFLYRDSWHDQAPKRVLDELDLPADGGMEDGLALLRFLAAHPLTGARICERLVDTFYSEIAESSRHVRRCERTFASTGGDLRAVVFRMLAGLRFTRFDPESRVKQPLHLIASVYRALGRVPDTDELEGVRGALRVLGHAPFEAGPPTGYPQHSSHWASEGGLLARFNLIRDSVELDAPDFGIVSEVSEDILAALIPQIAMGGVSDTTRSELLAYLNGLEGESLTTRVRDAAALLFSSPEFSRY